MPRFVSTDAGNSPSKPGTQGPAGQDQKMLRSLAKLWRSYHERGLKLRMHTGSLLNQRLGEPTIRLAHGRQLLKKAAERLQIAESDLSRMRWFAFLFTTVEDFQSKHPEVRSWTKVKELLPSLISRAHAKEKEPSTVEGSGGLPPGDQKTSAPVGAVVRYLGNATRQLRRGDVPLDDAARNHVCEAIRQLAEVAFERLQLRITIERG